MENLEQDVKVMITYSPKSVGIALLLTFIFGPIGMLYSTVWGGLIMLLINLPIAILTLGLGLIFTWPIQLIWAALAVRSYNKKLMNMK